MTAYYNEIDPFAAEWLRQLIKAGHIAPGVVDQRDIRDIKPNELSEFTQCHFFAGIGVWSYALRQAGWPDDRPVWTGSCPCQPFSAAGRRKGTSDERHLWPHWFHLIGQYRPNVIFGEQVAGKDGLAWLDTVQADMEALGHSVGTVPFPAAGVGAPHKRERIYFVADSNDTERRTDVTSRHNSNRANPGRKKSTSDVAECGAIDTLADSVGQGPQRRLSRGKDSKREIFDGRSGCGGTVGGFWSNAEWIKCKDGKSRAIEPCTFPLAYESPARVGRLRGYGNAIVAEQAKEFINAFMQYQSIPVATAHID